MTGLRKDTLVFLFLFLLAAAISVVSGCGGSADNPRDVVIQLFGAMERNERAALPHLLDMRAMMEQGEEDYALQRKMPRKFYSPEQIMDDLTDSGLTKTRWFTMQRIVGNTEMRGDSAWVEVSFVDKDKGVQYYNKFGLHRKKGNWKIYSFKTISR